VSEETRNFHSCVRINGRKEQGEHEVGIIVPLDIEFKELYLPYSDLPCILRGGFRRFRTCAPSFYAVGKIAKNGWRNRLVGHMPETWEEYSAAAPVKTEVGFLYTGPFFIRCDHACTHGNSSHATYSVCTAALSTTQEAIDFQPTRVFRQSDRQIRQAGFVFMWAGLEHESLEKAYGSLIELGIAHTLGKPILLAHHPKVDLRDFWFAVETASAVVCAENPVDALEMLWADRSAR
jgi:hypothetical protein